MNTEAAQDEKAKRLKWIFKLLFVFSVGGTLICAGVAALILWHYSRGLPNIITVADYRPLGVTRIIAEGSGEDGKEAVIGEFFKERRYLVPYEKIPEIVVQAFISAEDDQFFNHPGINVASIIRASLANFKAGHVVQGGSTITQQVAKSLLLTPEKSYVRKIKEVILASRIEKHLTKQQILYLYLNQIYLGHGAYGVQAASRAYFGKEVWDLNVAEAALLAGLPQAPGKYSPLLDPQKAKERQRYVLRRMSENGFISKTQLAEGMEQPVRLLVGEDANPKPTSYWVEHLRRYLVEKYGEKAVYEQGLTVTVPNSIDLMEAARKSLRRGLEAVDKRMGYRGPRRKLKSEEEIAKFLRQQRAAIIARHLKYQFLLPEGRLDLEEAARSSGVQSNAEYLKEGEQYEAVVGSVDDKRKVAEVQIGPAVAEIPFEKMKWARLILEDKGDDKGPRWAAAPDRPSQVVSKGEVVTVKIAEKGAQGVIAELDQEPLVEGALFSLDVRTGTVLAMEGGYDFERSEFNRAIQALRQPGSAFKPMIYSAALEKGFTPASVIVDSPLVYEDADTGKWKPSNFEEKFYGDTTFRQALIKSRNVPTIKIVQAIHVPFVIDYAKRLGLNGTFNADLSISLGSGAVNLMDLTRTYALFPRLGRRVVPAFFKSISDRDGKVLEENSLQPLSGVIKIPSVTPSPAPVVEATSTAAGALSIAPSPSPLPWLLPEYPLADDPDQVLDPRVAFVMTHLMKEVVTYGTGHAAKELGRPSAGKTGTTNEYNDAWFMGFTPHVVTGVWVGFDNHRALGKGETGAKAALPIWLDFMKEASKGYPSEDFLVPPGVVFASIDSISGKPVPPNSSRAIKEAFIEGTQPQATTGQGSLTPESQSEFFKEDIE